MSGGMTHIDTFDPKPENKDVMGETTAINTSADGIQVVAGFPKQHSKCIYFSSSVC